ncbi:UDP-N-acetylglucosamine transferase subunit ALG14-like protein, partial [Bienertia sinuspersici]
DILCCTSQLIHLKVQVVGSTKQIQCTFVYGYNEVGARDILWMDLIDIAKGHTSPWLVLGDFNNVLNYNGRQLNSAVFGDIKAQDTKAYQEMIKAQTQLERDENTHAFHQSIRSRRVHNRIHGIKDGEGQWDTDLDQISNAFLDFYKGLLGTKMQ